MTAHSDCQIGGAPHSGHHLSSGNATKTGTWCEGTKRLDVNSFPMQYRLRMIRAYPAIAQMTTDEMYGATREHLDEAFRRILDNRNLRRTHELYLEVRQENTR